MGLYTEMSVTANAVDVRPGAPVGPVFADAPYTRGVNENTKAGGYVGDPVTADRADRYELRASVPGSNDHRLFEITEHGQIMVKENPNLPLNHETQSTYTVKVVAFDEDNNEGSATVTINVVDLNEMPYLDARSRNLAPTPNENDSDQVADFDARDPENATIMWYVMGTGGVDANDDGDTEDDGDTTPDAAAAAATKFEIDNQGVLTFKGGNGGNFEDQETYNIRVLAVEGRTSDAATANKRAKTDYTDVTVTLQNVDEDGKVTFDFEQPEV